MRSAAGSAVLLLALAGCGASEEERQAAYAEGYAAGIEEGFKRTRTVTVEVYVSSDQLYCDNGVCQDFNDSCQVEVTGEEAERVQALGPPSVSKSSCSRLIVLIPLSTTSRWNARPEIWSAELRAQLDDARPVPRLAPKVLASRLAEWRRLLRGDVHQARAVLQRVLAGRVAFTWIPPVATFEAPTKFSGLFAGFTVDLLLPSFIREGDARGTEALDREAGRLEAIYEQLLKRAEARLTRKGVRPWWDSNPRSPP